MKTSQLCKTARPQPCRKDVRFNLTCVLAFHGLAFHWGMPGSRLFQFLQGEIQYFRLPLRQHCQEKLLLQITEEWGIMDQLLDLTHVDPGNNPAQGAVASLIPQRGNKIEIPDFFPLQRDRGGWYLINSVISVALIGKNRPHDLVIRLGIEAAPAVVDWSQFHGIAGGVVEEPPIPVVPVPVSDQRIHNEHIPKTIQQLGCVHSRLRCNGMEDVGKFRAIPIALRVDDLVFQRCKVLEYDPRPGKVAAGDQRFSLCRSL